MRLDHLLSTLAVRHVIDVGANVGQFAALIRDEVGFSGRIDSIEPVAGTYRQLAEARAGDRQWFGHQVAATAEPGEFTINVYSDSALNSLASTTKAGDAVFGGYHDFKQVGTETIQGVPLDALDLPDLGPTFLKVDTQGHDWDVMAGAEKTLDRVVLLSMELSFARLYDTSTPAWESLRRLDEMGFRAVHVERVCEADDPLALGEGDGFFIRR